MNNYGFIDELVLLGLKGGKENGLTASDVTKALTPFLARRNSDLLAALQRLAANGRIDEVPRKKGQRSKRWRIRQSESEAPPTRAGGRSPKQKAIRQLLAIHVLKLDPRASEAIVKGDGLLAYYLASRLGEQFDANTTVAGLAGLVTAKSLNLSRGDPDFIWEHLIHIGVDARESAEIIAMENASQQQEPISNSGQPSSTAYNERDPASIAAFAEHVKRAARNAKDGWFGPRKLFIHRAWEAWKTSSGEGVDLPAFKHRLLQGLRAGRIELSRADFPMGLEPADLQTALTQYGDETYHFITLDEEALQ